MTNPGPYLSWRVHVIKLMRDSGHRMDERGPVLTAAEVARMESFWYWGLSAEDFVATLNLIEKVGIVE